MCPVLGPRVTTCDSGGKQEQGGAGCQPAVDDCTLEIEIESLLDTVMMGGRTSYTMIFAADNIAAQTHRNE